MRFIHTADWHLGRLFYGVHLTDDQSHVLDQFVDLVEDQRPDIVLIAGDIYDRAVPPADAVELLDDVLTRIVLDLRVPVMLIAGNHDNPDRLEFGGRLLARQNLHVHGTLDSCRRPVLVTDKWGTVYIHPIPYCEPRSVRAQLDNDAIDCHDAAMRQLVAVARDRQEAGARSVIVAHAFVDGGSPTESERPLAIGGAEMVGADCFDGFHYVALGHLHRPQPIGTTNMRYPGSLLKYSLAEEGQTKLVHVVEMDDVGVCTVESVSFSPKRDVRRIRGMLQSLATSPPGDVGREDYLVAELLDEGALFDPIGRLREVFPNVLHIERPALAQAGKARWVAADPVGKSDLELFGDFFLEMTGKDLSDDQRVVFTSAVDAVRAQERG